MLLLRRGKGRLTPPRLHGHAFRLLSTAAAPLAGLAAKQKELENLRRAVQAARSAVNRAKAEAMRLANEEEAGKHHTLTTPTIPTIDRISPYLIPYVPLIDPSEVHKQP